MILVRLDSNYLTMLEGQFDSTCNSSNKRSSTPFVGRGIDRELDLRLFKIRGSLARFSSRDAARAHLDALGVPRQAGAFRAPSPTERRCARQILCGLC